MSPANNRFPAAGLGVLAVFVAASIGLVAFGGSGQKEALPLSVPPPAREITPPRPPPPTASTTTHTPSIPTPSAPKATPPAKKDHGESELTTGSVTIDLPPYPTPLSRDLTQPPQATFPPPPVPPQASAPLAPQPPPVSIAPLAVTVTPLGTAAGDRVLPPGAHASVRFTLRNTGKDPLTKIALKATVEGLKIDSPSAWRSEGGAFIIEIPRIGAGDEADRTIAGRVETAPPTPGGKPARIQIEAKLEDGSTAKAEASMRTADCAGAYRGKLAGIRTGEIEAVKKLADEIRKPEAGLTRGRSFQATGARSGELAVAERLAAQISGNGGGDPEMGSENMRFVVVRWTSELGAYTGQEKNAGLCTGAPAMLSVYRGEGLSTVRKRFDAIRAAAGFMLKATREATKASENEELAQIARRLAEKAGVEGVEKDASALAILARTRAFLIEKDRKIEGDEAQAFSLTETAAWLAEAEKRSQALSGAFDATLSAIAAAHKETCVCAY
jgi:hypothetical protein